MSIERGSNEFHNTVESVSFIRCPNPSDVLNEGIVVPSYQSP